MLNEKNFPPIMRLSILAYAIAGALDASKEQLENLQKAKNRPHVLDDDLIHQIITSYSEQNESILKEKTRCQVWKQEKLTSEQYKTIDKIEANLVEMEKVNQQILFLAKHYKDHTIDKILNMDECELAISFLSGKLYSPQAEEISALDHEQQKNSYPKNMLPMVNYEEIENEDTFSNGIVELEHDTMRNLYHFIEKLTEILKKEKMIQLPELMVAHLCAYLGFLTAVALEPQEAIALQPHILRLIETQSNQSYEQFTTYLGNRSTATQEENDKNLNDLRENSPSSIVAQTVRLGRFIWDSIQTLYHNRPLKLAVLNQKQTEFFCPQDRFIQLLKKITKDTVKEWENRMPLLFVINQTAFQIGWLIGYYGHYDKKPPAKYLEYGLSCVELYIEWGIKLRK
jgi:hypothetical protein